MRLNSKNIEKKAKRIRVYSFDTVDSTNKIAKDLATNGCDEGVVVCATRQTAGKGRLGRTFVSKRGGVYFSVVLRPESNNDNTIFITVAAAVAAAKAIEKISKKKCDIKWVNDIYINNKKVCGILTEGEFDAKGELNYAVLGVGINLFVPKGGFSSDLPLAGSVFCKNSKVLLKKRVKEQIVADFVNTFFEIYNDLEKKEFIKEYQKRSFLTGKEITYTKDGNAYNAIVVGIDDEARLVVKSEDKTEILSHGEIQIIGMEQLAI